MEALQIHGVNEEERRRSNRVDVDQIVVVEMGNCEGMQEREWSSMNFCESLNVFPSVTLGIETPDLTGMGRKQFHGTGWNRETYG